MSDEQKAAPADASTGESRSIDEAASKPNAPKEDDTDNSTPAPVTADDGVVIAPGKDDGAPGLRRQVIDALRKCFDPEIPVNIYDLGMIYNIDIDAENNVHFIMTLTSPSCPVAGSLPPDAERRVAVVEGVTTAKHELVWEPAWNPDLMHEAAKLELGFFDDDEEDG